MANFSRLFPFLGRFYPPSGGPPVYPRVVGDDVSFIHDTWKPDAKHVFYLTSFFQTTVAVAGNNTVGLIPEPAPGFVTIPISASCRVVQAAPLDRLGRLTWGATGNAADVPTGLWVADIIGDILLRRATFCLLPCKWPIPRGNRMLIEILGLVAGDEINAVSYSIQVPYECVDWVQVAMASNQSIFINTPT